MYKSLIIIFLIYSYTVLLILRIHFALVDKTKIKGMNNLKEYTFYVISNLYCISFFK